MLSGNDNRKTVGQFVPTTRSGVFTHLSSVRSLSVWHGRLFRGMIKDGFKICAQAYISLIEFCGEVSYDVVSRFMDVSGNSKKNSRRAYVIASVAAFATCTLGLIALANCVLAILDALFCISIVVLGLFIANNIAHTAILGVSNLTNEVASLWNSIRNAPVANFRAGANALERGFEAVLHRVTILTLAAIRIAPSVVVAAISVALNPLYMLFRTLLPKFDLAEDRAVKKQLLEIAEDLHQSCDAAVIAAAEEFKCDSRFGLPYGAVLEVTKSRVELVMNSLEVLEKRISTAAKTAEHNIENKIAKNNLSEDPEAMHALAVVARCKRKYDGLQAVGSAVLAKLNQSSESEAVEAKTPTKILNLMQSDSTLQYSRTLFVSDASFKLREEQKAQEKADALKVRTVMSGVCTEFFQTPNAQRVIACAC